MSPRAPLWTSTCLFSLVAITACATKSPAGGPAPAQTPSDGLAAAVATIRAEDLASHVETLASDAFAGRFPGTAGEVKTVSYISAHFARVGLRPTVGGSFAQPVPLVSATPDPSATLQAHGARGAATLRWGDDLLVGSPAATPEVTLRDAAVVFAGHGVVAPEYGWDDYGDVDVKGAIVVVLGGDPGPSPQEPTRFEGAALSYYGTSWHKGEAAASRGAAAVLELRADGHGGVAWQTLAVGARAPKMLLEDDGRPHKPALQGLIREEAAASLASLGGHELAQLKAAAATSGFRARSLGVRASITMKTERAAALSHNVIGVLPGARRPDEYVVYTAHWDHVGVRPELSGDKIFNGAVDNATGTAALLELAEAYAALTPPPERSIVFMATTAEEQGLLGARHYAAHPVFPLRDTVGVINMDALFPFGAFTSMTVVGLGSSELEDYLTAAAREVGRTVHADPSPELGAFFRSDHYPFAERGVPAIFAVGGPDPAAAPSPALIERFVDYVQRRYHQPGDEYNAATWDMTGIVQDVEVFLRTGVALARDDRFPNWRSGHVFRARRDAMRGS